MSSQQVPLAKPLAPAKFPLIRPYKNRVFAGVCRGVSLHLGLPVWVVRLVFFIGIFLGVGIVAYVFLWLTVPSADENWAAAYEQAHKAQAAGQTPLSYGNAVPADTLANDAPGNIMRTLSQAYTPSFGSRSSTSLSSGVTQSGPQQPSTHSTRHKKMSMWNLIGIILMSFIILYVGITAAVNREYLTGTVGLVLAVCIMIVVVEWAIFERFPVHKLVLVVASLALLITVIVFALFRHFGHTSEFTTLLWIMAITVTSIVLIVAPWLAQSNRNLAAQTAQKEREEERADMAAHLHDSVLQTLNLIRQNANDSQTVSRLARTQERELRRWLYEEREAATESIASSMKLVSAQVEDTFGKEIDVVTVGDAYPTERTQALLEATKQALTNACIHGAEPISLYVEAHSNSIDVFVRDHGDGFDPNHIPDDRMGIRHSICGRLERAGGTVKIVSRASWGTEVRMSLPLVPQSTQTSHAKENN